MLGSGVYYFIEFLSLGFSGSNLHTLLLAFAGPPMGAAIVASSVWRLIRPQPIVVIDSDGVAYRWMCRRRKQMPLNEVQRLVLFSHDGVRYVGFVGLKNIETGRQLPRRLLWRDMGGMVGEPTAFCIPDTILGSRFDERVSLVHEITGCHIVNK